MSNITGITWTDHAFNPWIGCTKVSPGCDNCYAEMDAKRYKRAVWGPGEERYITKTTWLDPIRWNRKAKKENTRHRVFCASLADVFDAEAPQHALPWLWEMIRQTP